MALQGVHGSPVRPLSALIPAESRCVREEAAARRRPAAASLSDAARQEDPAQRGVYTGQSESRLRLDGGALTYLNQAE